VVFGIVMEYTLRIGYLVRCAKTAIALEARVRRIKKMKTLSEVKRGKGISEETRKKWMTKFEAVSKKMQRLTEWETSFIINIQTLLSRNEDLSFQQSCTLNKIYERISK
jgi:hypothetical protein